MSYRIGSRREPQWYDLLDGLRVRLKPFDAALDMAAVHEATSTAPPLQLDDGELDVEEVGNRLLASDPNWHMRYLIAQARRFIVEWDGALDVNDEAAPCTPDNITEVMLCWHGQSNRFRQVLLDHFRDAEKNGSSGSLNGGSKAAKPTAGSAGSKASPVPKGNPAAMGNGAPSTSTPPRPN
jgi:hypothetical protein